MQKTPNIVIGDNNSNITVLNNVNINTKKKVSIAELQQCIADLINQKDFIKPHLATEVYKALQDDLEDAGQALAKPTPDVSKIQSVLQSIPNILNAIPNESIMKTVETLKMLMGLF